MANKNDKWHDNVPGKFYVDKDCVVCNICYDVAPAHFKMSEDGDHLFVSKQPTSDAELQTVVKAMDGCPMGAVGDDGDAE